MNDPKREDIKARIEASQARQAAGNAASAASGSGLSDDQRDGGSDASFIGFVRRHPLTTIAGSIAVGVLIAGMFPSARKTARQGGARATALGAAGTQAALAALNHVLEAAEEAGRVGGEKLNDLGDTIADTARSADREAHHLADRSGDSARIATRDTGEALTRWLHRVWR